MNIAARGDRVAFDPRQADGFGDMLTRRYIESIEGIFTSICRHYPDERGLNVHKSSDYPANPDAGSVVTAEGWQA